VPFFFCRKVFAISTSSLRSGTPVRVTPLPCLASPLPAPADHVATRNTCLHCIPDFPTRGPTSRTNATPPSGHASPPSPKPTPTDRDGGTLTPSPPHGHTTAPGPRSRTPARPASKSQRSLLWLYGAVGRWFDRAGPTPPATYLSPRTSHASPAAALHQLL
jgi:hypothetical protein